MSQIVPENRSNPSPQGTSFNGVHGENAQKLKGIEKNFHGLLTTSKNQISSLLQLMEQHPPMVALSTREGSRWEEVTYQQTVLSIRQTATYLLDNGLGSGKRIAIISDSRHQYVIAILATQLTGATVIPLDSKLTIKELSSICNHCEPDLLLFDSTYGEISLPLAEALHKSPMRLNLDFEAQGQPSLQSLTKDIEPLANFPDVDKHQTSLITYTSGTAGAPKGVMLSTNNLMSQVAMISSRMNIKGQSFLSILPMNHMFELTTGIFTTLYLGNTIYFARTIFPSQLTDICQDKKIAHMICVPLVLESFKSGIERKLKKQTKLKQFLFSVMLTLAAILPRTTRRMMFRPVHDTFGGQLKTLFSGGAPLSVTLFEFLERIGFHVLQGYGLSETSPVCTLNSYQHNKKGSVGKTFPGIELKLKKESQNDESGVLMVKGPHIMNGYFKNEEQTREVLSEDKWFNTGDLARIDNKGNVYITGRQKNMIVLHGGKKVLAEEVESVLQQNKNVLEICVVAKVFNDEQRGKIEQVCTVIVPTPDFLEENNHNLELSEKKILNEFEGLKGQLADHKWPRSFHFTQKELPKTTTKKIKRQDVFKLINKGT